MMNYKTIFSFLIGGAIGASITFYYMNNKLKENIEREVKGYKEITERLEKMQSELKQKLKDKDEEEKEKTKEQASKIIKSNNYNSISSSNKSTAQTVDDAERYPFIIPEEEIDENNGYKLASLTYYADGIVSDRFDEIIDEPDILIGTDAEKVLGDMLDSDDEEEKVIYVQNDKTKTYYKVVVDNDNYPYAY